MSLRRSPGQDITGGVAEVSAIGPDDEPPLWLQRVAARLKGSPVRLEPMG